MMDFEYIRYLMGQVEDLTGEVSQLKRELDYEHRNRLDEEYLRAQNDALFGENGRLLDQLRHLQDDLMAKEIAHLADNPEAIEIVNKHQPYNKIPAIKELREKFSIGLREAKRLQEVIFEAHQHEWLDKKEE